MTEWRNTAVFAHEEVEQLISDPRIPLDRQMVYALELLAGGRTGEAAALRWWHYDPTAMPLGKLFVAKSYNTRRNVEKTTKTDAVKHVPVHPVLAAMLAEWKLGGWAEMVGHAPGPGDLIVPLPPDAAERHRSRDGEPFRAHDYSGKRWRDLDGWRRSRGDRDARDAHPEGAQRVRRLQSGTALGADVRRDREAPNHARRQKFSG
jgi:hypothetical protein